MLYAPSIIVRQRHLINFKVLSYLSSFKPRFPCFCQAREIIAPVTRADVNQHSTTYPCPLGNAGSIYHSKVSLGVCMLGIFG
jgi:hypothetical protein